jgi:CHAT domain-containing protein
MVSSYTPTLTALLRAQQGAKVYGADQIKLLLVATEHAQNLALPPLPFVSREVETVTAITSESLVSIHQTAVKSGVVERLASANVVHLACHGIQDAREPHNSHFCLGDGSLTVAELMSINLQDAFFAFLSACETAKGDRTHVDEAIHLAATMLFVGFKSVAATMWYAPH